MIVELVIGFGASRCGRSPRTGGLTSGLIPRGLRLRRALAALDLVEHRVELLRGEALVELVVDLHHRRVAAAGGALGLLERPAAVLAGLVRVAAEALLEVLLDRLAAHQIARERAAHPHDVLRD